MFEKSTSDARPHTTSTEHRCAAGPACQNAEKIDGKRHGARTTTPNTLCDSCTTHIANCTRQLTRDYDQLAESLGDSATIATITGEFVKSSPTPAIPINAAAEAIMTSILEIADRAAAVVSEALRTDQPDGRRKLQHNIVTEHIAAIFDIPLGPYEARPGSIAATTYQTHVHATPRQKLTAAVRLIEPNITTLTAAPPEPHLVWAQPRRCDHHAGLIGSAEAWLGLARPAERDKAKDELAAALHAASACDDCNGWSHTGQARGFTEYTGIDIAQQLRNIHHQARAHLGHTRLRNNFSTPCPGVNAQGVYCGALTVGHDDGSDWVDCTTCGAQWLEDEWDFLSTLIKDWEIEMVRWLLAEAYWRLDTLQRGATAIRDDPRMNEPGSGHFVLEGIDIVLNAGTGHKPPTERQTTTERKKGGKRK